MKYIRAHTGEIYSVSQLIPPKRLSHEGGPVWQLKLITLDGQRQPYAQYDEEVLAVAAWQHVMAFMGGGHTLLSFDEPGEMPVVEFWASPLADAADAAEVATTGEAGAEDVEYVETEEENAEDE